jgi:hypothetical protein
MHVRFDADVRIRADQTGIKVMKTSRTRNPGKPSTRSVRPKERKLKTKFFPAQIKTATVAKLIFDSFKDKISISVRASAPGARQLLYQYGNLSIDMQLQPKPRSNRILLMGQVLDSERPVEGLGAIPVSLLDQEDAISETTTNRFGEFNLSFESKNDLRVFLDMKNALVVSLPNSQVD